METTRHFTATTYVVEGDATALHLHDRLEMWLPPGGHIDRDELPREAAAREVLEETGQEVALLEPDTTIDTGTVRELPGPEYLLLEDIHHYEPGEVGHQHIDFIFFGSVPSRDIEPDGTAERTDDHWRWFDEQALSDHPELTPEVRDLGVEAIRAVRGADTDQP